MRIVSFPWRNIIKKIFHKENKNWIFNRWVLSSIQDIDNFKLKIIFRQWKRKTIPNSFQDAYAKTRQEQEKKEKNLGQYHLSYLKDYQTKY